MASSSNTSKLFIPERSSSKRALEEAFNRSTEELQQCEKEVKDRIKRIRTSSFDIAYWRDYQELGRLQVKRSQIFLRKSHENFLVNGGAEESWSDQIEARDALQQLGAHQFALTQLEETVPKLEQQSRDIDQDALNLFMHMITLIPMEKGGIGASKAGLGRRDPSLQSKFREALFEKYRPKNPEMPNTVWCPLSGGFVQLNESFKAAHIFPYAGGQDMMDKIFGRQENQEPEMFSPENGLLLSDTAEKLMGSGLITLVPNISPDATDDEVRGWTESAPKSYKIRILDKTSVKVQEKIGIFFTPQDEVPTWLERDGKVVDFRSDFRPRARYLYWHFASAMIKEAWSGKKPPSSHNILVKKEFGRQYWGTRGPWIRKKYLLGFAQHLGHAVEWDELTDAYQAHNLDEEVSTYGVAGVGDDILMRPDIRSHNEAEDEEDDEEFGVNE